MCGHCGRELNKIAIYDWVEITSVFGYQGDRQYKSDEEASTHDPRFEDNRPDSCSPSATDWRFSYESDMESGSRSLKSMDQGPFLSVVDRVRQSRAKRDSRWLVKQFQTQY